MARAKIWRQLPSDPWTIAAMSAARGLSTVVPSTGTMQPERRFLNNFFRLGHAAEHAVCNGEDEGREPEGEP